MREEHYAMADYSRNQNLHAFEKVVVLSTLVVGLLIISLTIPVMAATGTFTSIGGLSGTSHFPTFDAAGYTVKGIYVKNIQNQTGFNSLFITNGQPGTSFTDSNSTSVGLYVGNTQIGSGLFGYTKSVGTYTVYLYMSYFNVGTLTGDHYVNFTDLAGVNSWHLGNLQLGQTYTVPTVNQIYFSELNTATGFMYKTYGSYTSYQSREFRNDYTTSYTAPLSSITLTRVFSSKPYPSKIYIMGGTTVAASNTTLSADPYTTSVAGLPYYTINVTDMWNNWYVSPVIYGSDVAPVYVINISPGNITTTTTALGGITSATDVFLSAVIDIGWKWSDADASYYNEFYDGGNTSRPLQYTKKGTTWYGWDNLANDFVVNKGTIIPNPVTLSGITTTGDKTVRCVVSTSDGNVYILTAPLTVGGASAFGTVSTGAKLIDALTGNYIVGGTVSFQNVATGAWTNQTTTPTGTVYVSSSPTVKWNIVGTAAGYIPVSRFGLDSSSGSSVNTYALTMYPSSYTPAPGGETTLLATVTSVCQQQYQGECSDLPLGGVTITIRSTDGVTFSQSATTGTGTSGTITMFIPNNTAYFWSASGKPGYQDVSGNFTVNAEPVYTLGIQMAQIFVTPTPSLAPGQTPMPTGVTPTMTQAPGQSSGEFQAFRAFDAVAGALWGWAQVGVGIVSIWLLWILVYEMTGGKVIEKIMRRGRKR